MNGWGQNQRLELKIPNANSANYVFFAKKPRSQEFFPQKIVFFLPMEELSLFKDSHLWMALKCSL